MELVVVMVITGVLSVLAFSGFNALLQSLTFVTNTINLMHDINNTASRFELDVRNIGIDTTGGGYVPEVLSFDANTFAFRKNDGSTVVYLISGNRLYRNGKLISFNQLDASNSSFSFSGYSGGVEVDAIAGGLAANEVRKVTFKYTFVRDDLNFDLTQTFALNYR